ncbi:hypothetical protein PIB30_039966 [Stylosanthes scabra]|uniref:Uncharacterized protein n=1 Tax=Stylosanthes scabra TaxID=79078 RepID=A0ABU6UDS9_9FABA|nr:hypothetical protein [Stylosanthes scabra]
MVLVPLGLLINLSYHIWLWHRVRTQPFLTIFGIDVHGRSLWISSMIKDIEKKNIVAVQSIRNMIMGSSIMANTSILLCCGLGALISSNYTLKKPPIYSSSIYGAHGELAFILKYAILFTLFLFSFLFHTLSIRFFNQLTILISTPQQNDIINSNVTCIVTIQYLNELMRKANILGILGNRVFHMGLPLLLWIFGPVMAFSCSLAMVVLFHKLDFVDRNNKEEIKMGIDLENGMV